MCEPKSWNDTATRAAVLDFDAEREFEYTAGAEKSPETAAAHAWTVVSSENERNAVFADESR
jgi:hypothetical protein